MVVAGGGVESDMIKGQALYWELAAIKGDAGAIGTTLEIMNIYEILYKAMKHYMIAAGTGSMNSR